MGLPGRQQSVLDMLALIQVCSLLAVATAAPQFRAISEVVKSQTGEVIPVDENNQDIAGCLVGPSGERVCPLVAVGSDGRKSGFCSRQSWTWSDWIQRQCWPSERSRPGL